MGEKFYTEGKTQRDHDIKKTVNEISQFILKSGVDLEDEKWQEDMAHLFDKANKRLGYHVDQNEILAKVYQGIVDDYNLGLMGSDKKTANFCHEIEVQLQNLKTSAKVEK